MIFQGLMNLIRNTSLEIALLKWLPYLPAANELALLWTSPGMGHPHLRTAMGLVTKFGVHSVTIKLPEWENQIEIRNCV